MNKLDSAADSPAVLAEVDALSRGESRIRIPPSIDVPLTPRVRRIIDTIPMQRLAQISQLGLVRLVYPGATHSRLEHSLGVYTNALKILKQQQHWFSSRNLPTRRYQSVRADLSRRAQEAFVVAALIHDVGHWPFCHPIEDMGNVGSVGQVKHEERVESFLSSGELANCLASDWQCSLDDVMAILCPKTMATRRDCELSAETVKFYGSCLSGPIDIDKLDYLQRDSLHAGVPYGRNFDPDRITHAWQPHPDQPKLAINEKGRTAAEMMVFGRYVMFSEVYWHHTVRAATAMLQRGVFALQHSGNEDRVDLTAWANLSESDWITEFRAATTNCQSPYASSLVDGLFAGQRRLYKRIAEYHCESGGQAHHLLARRPYWWLVACTEPLAAKISDHLGCPVDPMQVLIDAPPTKLEVDINIDVVSASGQIHSLGELSPVTSVLANQQFDNHVKRVRVFVAPEIREAMRRQSPPDESLIESWLLDAATETEASIA